ETGVLVDAPAGVVAKVGDDKLHRLEGAVPVAERDVNAGVAEADDVEAAVARHVGKEARVPIDMPAAAFEPEVRKDEADRLECAVPVTERDVYAGAAGAD